MGSEERSGQPLWGDEFKWEMGSHGTEKRAGERMRALPGRRFGAGRCGGGGALSKT